ncbi:MAG: HAMP domain-containing protein [Acidobacteria bacterium]|nr:HAMP domain-containing protein [Acidobacteriota bacterium]
MKSLFFRLFLWFWLSLVLVGAVFVVSSPFLTRTHPRLAHWEQSAGERALIHVERVAKALEQQGPKVLETAQARRRMGRARGPIPMIQVFDENGVEITGLPVDPEARRLASRALEQGEAMAERLGVRHLSAEPVIDPTGRQFVVVGIILRHPSPVDLLEPGVLLPRLFLLALVAAVLVWWMARHLSSPVGALREATGALASGDLSARVPGMVVGRHDEFGQLARDFNGMAEHIERMVENQRRLLGDVSHELRSPLARLNVALELARQKAHGAAEGALDRVELESSRLDDLISRLLEFTRLDNDQLERIPVDLVGLTEEIVADAAFENTGAELHFDRPSAGEVCVLGDAAQLRAAIDNVIRNAVFFSGSATTVEIEVEITDSFARIRVADRGPGIPEEELTRVFEVFYRIEDARDRGRGGAGLGLAIASRAVQLHGGSITARNRDGGGLIVEIDLPCA